MNRIGMRATYHRKLKKQLTQTSKTFSENFRENRNRGVKRSIEISKRFFFTVRMSLMRLVSRIELKDA